MRLPDRSRIEVAPTPRLTTRDERDRLLRAAGLNVYRLPPESVALDLLGVPPAHARPADAPLDHFRSEEMVREVFDFRHILPTRHGRTAAHLLFSVLARAGDTVPNNLHLDPTRGQLEARGVIALPLPLDAGRRDPQFPGNLDPDALERTLRDVGPETVPLVLLTITDHSSGGQPVSLANARAVSRVCRGFGVPLYFDARRFAENVLFIQERESGEARRELIEIARELFSHGDGALLSVEPEDFFDPGGFLATNDDLVHQAIARRVLRVEGLPPELDEQAGAVLGSLEEEPLRARVAQIRRLGELLGHGGVPVLHPVGGRALYVDARAFAPHIPPRRFPGQALTVALYRDFGVRAVEIGSLRFWSRDPITGEARLPGFELVRLTAPPSSAAAAAADLWVGFLADAILDLHRRREAIRGLRLLHDAPLLRHYTARLEEVD